MDIVRVAGDLVTAMLLLFTSTGWPPAAAGAFWILLAAWGVVSVLFDDETPRGIPGLDIIMPGRFEENRDQKTKSGQARR